MINRNLISLILSRFDIDKFKYILGNTPLLDIPFKVLSQNLIDYHYPAHLFIEATRACNLKCIFCPRELRSLKAGHMDFGLFCKIIDEATRFGRRSFCLHMFGESLLHPRITEMVRYIKKSDPRHCILLTTNGYFLDESKARKMLEDNIDKITFSIFSLKNDRNIALTGDENIHRVIENIRHLSGLKKEMRRRTKIAIRFILGDENCDEKRQLQYLAKSLGVTLEVRPAHNYGGVINNSIISRILPARRYPCYHPWFSPAVTWDGKVVLCCSDWNYSTVLGDVAKETLSSIWQGAKMKEFRLCHLKGRYDKISLCSKCDVWRLYPDIFLEKQKR